MKRLRGQFGGVLCEIRVASTSATPYLVDDRKNVVRWFPDSNGSPVDFRAESASEALAKAVAFLEEQVGRHIGKLSYVVGPVSIEAPRIPPATIT